MPSHWLASLIIALTAGTAGSAPETPDGRLAAQTISQDEMQLEVEVNGVMTLATVDTGATYAMVDQDLLPQVDAASISQMVTVVGIGGVRDYPAVEVPSFRIGNIELGPMPAALNDSRKFPGPKTVLPASAFEGRVLDIDYQQRWIESYDGSPKRPTRSMTCRMDYREIHGLPFIDITMNGKSAIALIDTGSQVTVINPVLAARARTRTDMALTQELFGADLSKQRAIVKIARRLQIGNHMIRRMRVLSTDSEFFAHVGLDDQPAMILGQDVLQEFRIQFDRQTDTIAFSRRLRPDELFQRNSVLARRRQRIQDGC